MKRNKQARVRVGEEVPYWLGANLVMTVTALEDRRLQAVANVSGGHLTLEDLEDRLKALGARPVARDGGNVHYGLVTQTADVVEAVGVATAQPQALGMLMRFVRDPEMDLWDTEILDLDWAESLFQRTSARPLSVRVYAVFTASEADTDAE